MFRLCKVLYLFAFLYVMGCSQKTATINPPDPGDEDTSQTQTEDRGYKKFNQPTSVTVAGGYLYVTDTGNHRIQKWQTGGTFVNWLGAATEGWHLRTTTTAGNGDREFNTPSQVSVDGSANLYVADTANHRIQKWTSSGSYQGWFGGGVNGWRYGLAPSSGSGDYYMNSPKGVFVGSGNDVFVADTGNHRIQKWNSAGEYQGWIGSGMDGWKSSGTASSAGTGNYVFSSPQGLCVDGNGVMYIADTGNHRIQKWNSSGNYEGWLGGGQDGWRSGTAPSSGNTDRYFSSPTGVTVDGSGNIYVVDSGNHRIQKWSSDGNYEGSIGTVRESWQTAFYGESGNRNLEFNNPVNIFFNSADGSLYIAEKGNYRIQKSPPTLIEK